MSDTSFNGGIVAWEGTKGRRCEVCPIYSEEGYPNGARIHVFTRGVRGGVSNHMEFTSPEAMGKFISSLEEIRYAAIEAINRSNDDVERKVQQGRWG